MIWKKKLSNLDSMFIYNLFLIHNLSGDFKKECSDYFYTKWDIANYKSNIYKPN